jgi:BirA family transcriptional regulator, biotin operon repressor / biotin---[acetyl-CoA-carboxylase] ligase
MIDAAAPVEMFEDIDSTLLEARRRAARPEFAPVWLLARRQSAGRGRRGRAWVSLDGNLFATHLFTTDAAPSEVAMLGFAAGVAIAETLEAFGVADAITLKWPNDVMIGGAKGAGILIESGACAGGLWAALAFGINLAAAPPQLDQPTTCLRAHLPQTVETPSPAAFFASLRPRLEAWSHSIRAEGFERLRAAWLSRAHGLGAPARVVQGDATIEGAIAGLSPRGELELDTPNGRRLIAAGDVFFSSAA